MARQIDHATRSAAVGVSLLAIASALGCSRSGLPGDGAQAGSGADRDPDRENCRSVTLEGEVGTVVRPGAVLLVFDRSGSMAEPWNERPRWQVAGEAIVSALENQPSALAVGAVFFPSPDFTPTCIDPSGVACMFVPGFTLGEGSCDVGPIDAADQIDFAPPATFLREFAGDPERGVTPKHAPVTGGMTPLTEALLVARGALAGGADRGVTSVVIITDGEPNCGWDEERSSQVVAEWREAGITTSVLGLPGLRNLAKPTLDGLAEAGGTDMFITPEDAEAIEHSLDDILEQNVSLGFDSCRQELTQPALAPRELRVIVDERGRERTLAPRDAGGRPSYHVEADGSAVELLGNTCAAAMSGAYRSIRLEFDCSP